MTLSGHRSSQPGNGIFRRFAATAILAVIFVSEVPAQKHHHGDQPLGTVKFPVSCSEQAQEEFNRAAALLHHMTYEPAQKAFEKVAKTDSKCAMAHWGIAMTLFQPLWPTRPGTEDLQRGWREVEKAKLLQPATERERLFVAAAEAFFLDPASSDYWLRIRRWEEAMDKLYKAFNDDPEVSAFFALAHLATNPSNKISRTNADRAAEILLRLYEQHPDHPGAMHYLVHANDMPGREHESSEVTRKYELLAPRNPHALHMPTHIYTRLGDWDGVIRGNLKSAEAALEHRAGPKGEFIGDEFPHAIEYLIYAYLQKGSDNSAAFQLKRLQTIGQLDPTFKSAFHLASTRARYALERHAWREAARIVPRTPSTLNWNQFMWPEAIAWFAQGLGSVHLGEIKKGETARVRLEELEAITNKAREELFARNIKVLRLELQSWIEHMSGRPEKSVALMREAAEIEMSTPKHAVTPGPTLPAHELLGDLLMEQKQPAEALKAYEQSIKLYPGRFNSLLGAARAARAIDNPSVARGYYQKLHEIAKKGVRSQLTEVRRYLSGGR